MILLLSILLSFVHPTATTYYFSAAGNDSNTGTSDVQPWKTIAKFNAATFSAGDHIYFRRGDVFTGAVNISQGITIGAYGTGVDPVINGLQTVTGFTAFSGSIYRAPVTVPGGGRLNLLVLNGANIPMGRLPKSTGDYGGFWTVDSHAANSITSSSLAGATFTGQEAEIVVRPLHEVLERRSISTQAGTTVSYSGSNIGFGVGNGFFIQNHITCLTQQGDWCYNSSTGYLYIYLATAPSNYTIQIPSVMNLVTATNVSNITIDGLNFTGSNNTVIQAGGISGGNPSRMIFQNSKVSFAGVNGMQLVSTFGNTIENNVFENINNNAINGISDVSNGSGNSSFLNNTFSNVGIWAGMGLSGYAAYCGLVNSVADNCAYSGNNFFGNGYCSLYLFGTNISVTNNYFNSTCLLLDDGGAIYLQARGGSSYVQSTASLVRGNVVVNTLGNPYGISNNERWGSGIYMDDRNNNVDILSNSVAGSGLHGMYIHVGFNMRIKYNTLYNNAYGISFEESSSFPGNQTNTITMIGNTIATKGSQNLVLFRSEFPDDRSTFATALDSNRYFQATTSAPTFYTSYKMNGGSNGYGKDAAASDFHLTYSGWQSLGSYDSHGSNSSFTSNSDTRFDFNVTGSAKTVSLPGVYQGLSGASYNGSITLPPYTSMVLNKVAELPAAAVTNSILKTRRKQAIKVITSP